MEESRDIEIQKIIELMQTPRPLVLDIRINPDSETLQLFFQCKFPSGTTHFPKNRKCDNCLRTQITRAPCRKGSGTVVSGNLGGLITADQRILSEGCESRNNYRYAAVGQDLATEWLQSYQCKTKTSQETQKSLMKFLEPTRKPKVIYTDNSLEFGKACED